MAPTVNDIIQITDVQTYLGQTMLNVYFYRIEELGSAVSYEDITNLFQTQIVLNVVPVQNNNCVHTSAIVKNLTNGLDLFEDVSTTPGTVSTESGPSFVALSFRLVRSSLATRHGSKRIGGLDETVYAGNSLAIAFNTAVATIATKIGGPLLQESAGDEDILLQPVIVGRYHSGSPNAGELDLSNVVDVSAAQFIRVSTQVTRRAGRGV